MWNQRVTKIILINEWNNIGNILFECTFSVVDDKEEIFNLYGKNSTGNIKLQENRYR